MTTSPPTLISCVLISAFFLCTTFSYSQNTDLEIFARECYIQTGQTGDIVDSLYTFSITDKFDYDLTNLYEDSILIYLAEENCGSAKIEQIDRNEETKIVDGDISSWSTYRYYTEGSYRLEEKAFDEKTAFKFKLDAKGSSRLVLTKTCGFKTNVNEAYQETTINLDSYLKDPHFPDVLTKSRFFVKLKKDELIAYNREVAIHEIKNTDSILLEILPPHEGAVFKLTYQTEIRIPVSYSIETPSLVKMEGSDVKLSKEYPITFEEGYNLIPLPKGWIPSYKNWLDPTLPQPISIDLLDGRLVLHYFISKNQLTDCNSINLLPKE